MSQRICIRKEIKNRWERRSPLSPEAVGRLIQTGLDVAVEKSPIRVYPDQAYAAVGCRMVDDCNDAQVVIGIKEPPVTSIQRGQVHLAFSHTIKGQEHNMPLLRAFLDQKATLLDYETMTDDRGKRVIAFGRFAGIAGAIDTLWIAGRKLALRDRPSGLSQLRQTVNYTSIEDAQRALRHLIPLQGPGLRFVIVGGGNSGRGAEEVLQWLGIPKVRPDDVLRDAVPAGHWYTLLRTPDVMEQINGEPFSWSEYADHGRDRYRSRFDRFLGKFDILLQAAYWDQDVPKHLNLDRMRAFRDRLPWLVGDISCDIDGSLACTNQATNIDEPAYTFDLDTLRDVPGITWDGPTVMAVDNLPCELSHDASQHFSTILEPMVPEIAKLGDVDGLETLPDHIARSAIVFRGDLTPRFRHLEEYL